MLLRASEKQLVLNRILKGGGRLALSLQGARGMSSREGGAAEWLSLWPSLLGPHPLGLTFTEYSEELANQK